MRHTGGLTRRSDEQRGRVQELRIAQMDGRQIMKWKMKSQTEITLEGTKDEIDAIESMLMGATFAGTAADRSSQVVKIDRHFPPDLSPDPETHRHFPPLMKAGKIKARGYWDRQFDFMSTPVRDGGCPVNLKDISEFGIGIYVQHLQGYGCEPEALKRKIDYMNSIGFACMRSPRGEDGKYWEAWYLPGDWAAQGEMKDQKLHAILCAVIRNVCPGSIDLVQQHCALTIDD